MFSIHRNTKLNIYVFSVRENQQQKVSRRFWTARFNNSCLLRTRDYTFKRWNTRLLRQRLGPLAKIFRINTTGCDMKVKVKVYFALEQAMKAQRGRKGIAPPFL